MTREGTRTGRAGSGQWREPKQGTVPDLRRRIDRSQADRIVARASFLPHRDRVLLEAYFLHGRTVRDIALGNGEEERRVSRRIRSLALRVLSERYAYVLRNLETWSPSRRRVARAMMLHGQSMREAAGSLRMTLYSVRQHYEAVKMQFEMESRVRSAAARSA